MLDKILSTQEVSKLLIGINIGLVFGFLIAAVIAVIVWAHLTPGDDHPLSLEEIRERVGEAWGR